MVLAIGQTYDKPILKKKCHFERNSVRILYREAFLSNEFSVLDTSLRRTMDQVCGMLNAWVKILTPLLLRKATVKFDASCSFFFYF